MIRKINRRIVKYFENKPFLNIIFHPLKINSDTLGDKETTVQPKCWRDIRRILNCFTMEISWINLPESKVGPLGQNKNAIVTA